MPEQFEQEFMEKEDKDELTWDNIKDQLNEDKPIVYDGQFTKEMFLEAIAYCQERKHYEAGKSLSQNVIRLFNNPNIPNDEIMYMRAVKRVSVNICKATHCIYKIHKNLAAIEIHGKPFHFFDQIRTECFNRTCTSIS